jgi:imidazolonepropionase-like amidohydrolase
MFLVSAIIHGTFQGLAMHRIYFLLLAYPHRESSRQLSRMVQFGMTPIQTLQSATINAAMLLKEQENFGALRRRKYADISAVRGDPLTNVRLLEDVSFVMKVVGFIRRRK